MLYKRSSRKPESATTLAKVKGENSKQWSRLIVSRLRRAPVAYFCDLAAADHHAIRTGCGGSVGRVVSTVSLGVAPPVLKSLLPWTFAPTPSRVMPLLKSSLRV